MSSGGGDESPEPLSPSTSSSTSDTDSEGDGRPGLPFRRYGKFSVPRLGRNQDDNEEQDDDDDDEDDTPAFLPLSSPREELNEPDLRETLRQQPGRHDLQSEASDEPTPLVNETSTSSVSSGMGGGNSQTTNGFQPARRHGPVGGRAADLAQLSPRQRGQPRSGSEGTPSMGSSFSDLDGKHIDPLP